jgi:hypothetical protein
MAETSHQKTPRVTTASTIRRTRTRPDRCPVARRPARRRRRSRSSRRVGPQVSGARADDRDPKLLADAVERLVETKGGRPRSMCAPCSRAGRSGRRDQRRPLSSRGVRGHGLDRSHRLDGVGGPAAYMAPQLVAMLNEHWATERDPDPVLGPDAPSWKKGRRSVRDGRGPRDTYG